MSNYEIDIFSSGKEKSITTHADILRTTHPWIPNNNYLLEHTLWKTYEAPDYNFVINSFELTNVYDSTFEFVTRTLKLKIECADERRGFFIKIPNTIYPNGTTDGIKTETIILCCAHQNGTQYPINCPYFSEGANTRYTSFRQNDEPYVLELGNTRTRTARLFVLSPSNLHEYVYEKLTGDSVAGDVNHHNLTAEEKTDVYNKLLAVLNGVTYTLSDNTIDIQEFRSFRDGSQFNINDFGMLGDERRQLATYDQLPLPIFDYTQTEDILKYINTGDKSGALDVFDSNNPDKEVIDDYRTNYRVFVTPWEGDKRDTKFTVIGYNSQLIENIDNLSKDYSMFVYASNGGELQLLQQTPMEKYPTVGWYSTITGNYTTLFNFGLSDSTEHDISTQIDWSYKPESAVNIKVNSVHRGTETLSKANILDGYRYTSQDGTFVDVIFRAPNIEDLDGGYSPKEDHEDDKSGTDSDFSGASGLRTFNISNSDFETINKKLWSTDWSTVFKSSSIDPVKCVISCKGIPFTADSVSSAEVVIANMDTGLNKNYVKSVKSFNVGSVLMPHYNDDFTDITLTHIRCYLPYIGWVELPASECMSRVAYSNVGIEARPKRLKFKYLVDFVDGSVRCVVSVNDTERWFFDGNCSVDIPVTSDNHTQAVSNALRSGLQTGLSIATAVAGAYTSNAGAVAGGVIGAMQNAPNIFPTYSYTATANGSGYINASMNTHIMIVIERPNTIKSTDYAKRVGVPCGLSLNLGSLHGFTVCKEVDVTGIDATPDELAMIKSLLESGVYL